MRTICGAYLRRQGYVYGPSPDSWNSIPHQVKALDHRID